jgi:phosphohistidine swiveling domain-containing protein
MALATPWQATFNGTQDFIDIVISDQGTTNYGVFMGVETDAPVVAYVDTGTAKTSTGFRLAVSDRFTGTINGIVIPR